MVTWMLLSLALGQSDVVAGEPTVVRGNNVGAPAEPATAASAEEVDEELTDVRSELDALRARVDAAEAQAASAQENTATLQQRADAAEQVLADRARAAEQVEAERVARVEELSALLDELDLMSEILEAGSYGVVPTHAAAAERFEVAARSADAYGSAREAALAREGLQALNALTGALDRSDFQAAKIALAVAAAAAQEARTLALETPPADAAIVPATD